MELEFDNKSQETTMSRREKMDLPTMFGLAATPIRKTVSPNTLSKAPDADEALFFLRHSQCGMNVQNHTCDPLFDKKMAVEGRKEPNCTDCMQKQALFEESETEEFRNMRVTREKRSWNMGKISVIVMILFTATDFLLHLVEAQMVTLDEPDHYDALSADVIRPAFRYHASSSESVDGKPRLGLGSAAISSVTTALSPILPFTGGLDLRREDYWTNGWCGSFASVFEQVRVAFAGTSRTYPSASLSTARGGATSPGTDQMTSKKPKPQHSMAMSSSEPFVPLEDIAQLTLRDVSVAFRFAVESTRQDFSRAKFFNGLGPKMKKLLEQISTASVASRGAGIPLPVTGVTEQAGEIDALNFCAAMRIFAEWRVLRQVPEGYKGYAVGMSLGQKDVIQNVAKIEQAIHDYVDHHIDIVDDLYEDPDDAKYVHSPTLRDLLQFEHDTNVHDNTKLPRLKDKTAAMGLLWVRRQLHYQTAIFANVKKIPHKFETAKEAVTAAYSEVYDKFHGWAVQKIFSYSFQAAPDAVEVYKVMNPKLLKEVDEAARAANSQSPNADKQSAHNSHDYSGGNPFEKFGRHVGREWEKLAGAVGQLFGQPADPQLNLVRGGGDETQLGRSKMIEFINKEMEKDAHKHIDAYLEVVNPLLMDLEELFKEFNMDDPTKV